MYSNRKITLTLFFLIIFLTGCMQEESIDSIKNIDNQNSDKQELQPQKSNVSTIGYIQTIDSEEIWVTLEANPETKNSGVIVDITGIEEENISKLVIGQKVKVINHKQMIHPSNPAREKADAIEIIKE
ncbi:hypothetical protein [Sporosarcina sp. BP05]|uniref:hypothetical protein n=1 Tax=Sporosarcina sp. BP05 TaxID=2758726 RepID=UPI0016444FBF|nr:hypothetical protein [Sporosarcina sp. BP05]